MTHAATQLSDDEFRMLCEIADDPNNGELKYVEPAMHQRVFVRLRANEERINKLAEALETTCDNCEKCEGSGYVDARPYAAKCPTCTAAREQLADYRGTKE